MTIALSSLLGVFYSAPSLASDAQFWLGADVSWLSQMQDEGYHWLGHSGETIDPLPWLKSQELTALRYRLWVNAGDDTYNNLPDVIRKAKQAEALGFQWMLDFHFSDTWTDPGNQQIPQQWRDHSVDALQSQLQSHITQTLTQIKQQGLQPTWIQIGNEVNHGFLWPVAQAAQSQENFTHLYTAAANTAKSIMPGAKLILHIADCSEIGAYYYLVPPLLKNQAPVDIIGVSAYYHWSEKPWQSYHQQCATNLNKLITAFNREVMVVEVGAPWFEQDSAVAMRDFYQALSVVKQKQIGVFYWEPLASNFQGYALGAFSPAGSPMPLWDEFVAGLHQQKKTTNQ